MDLCGMVSTEGRGGGSRYGAVGQVRREELTIFRGVASGQGLTQHMYFREKSLERETTHAHFHEALFFFKTAHDITHTTGNKDASLCP